MIFFTGHYPPFFQSRIQAINWNTIYFSFLKSNLFAVTSNLLGRLTQMSIAQLFITIMIYCAAQNTVSVQITLSDAFIS